VPACSLWCTTIIHWLCRIMRNSKLNRIWWRRRDCAQPGLLDLSRIRCSTLSLSSTFVLAPFLMRPALPLLSLTYMLCCRRGSRAVQLLGSPTILDNHSHGRTGHDYAVARDPPQLLHGQLQPARGRG
jgi:hypothetical protein